MWSTETLVDSVLSFCPQQAVTAARLSKWHSLKYSSCSDFLRVVSVAVRHSLSEEYPESLQKQLLRNLTFAEEIRKHHKAESLAKWVLRFCKFVDEASEEEEAKHLFEESYKLKCLGVLCWLYQKQEIRKEYFYSLLRFCLNHDWMAGALWLQHKQLKPVQTFFQFDKIVSNALSMGTASSVRPLCVEIAVSSIEGMWNQNWEQVVEWFSSSLTHCLIGYQPIKQPALQIIQHLSSFLTDRKALWNTSTDKINQVKKFVLQADLVVVWLAVALGNSESEIKEGVSLLMEWATSLRPRFGIPEVFDMVVLLSQQGAHSLLRAVLRLQLTHSNLVHADGLKKDMSPIISALTNNHIQTTQVLVQAGAKLLDASVPEKELSSPFFLLYKVLGGGPEQEIPRNFHSDKIEQRFSLAKYMETKLNLQGENYTKFAALMMNFSMVHNKTQWMETYLSVPGVGDHVLVRCFASFVLQAPLAFMQRFFTEVNVPEQLCCNEDVASQLVHRQDLNLLNWWIQSNIPHQGMLTQMFKTAIHFFPEVDLVFARRVLELCFQHSEQTRSTCCEIFNSTPYAWCEMLHWTTDPNVSQNGVERLKMIAETFGIKMNAQAMAQVLSFIKCGPSKNLEQQELSSSDLEKLVSCCGSNCGFNEALNLIRSHMESTHTTSIQVVQSFLSFPAELLKQSNLRHWIRFLSNLPAGNQGVIDLVSLMPILYHLPSQSVSENLQVHESYESGQKFAQCILEKSKRDGAAGRTYWLVEEFLKTVAERFTIQTSADSAKKLHSVLMDQVSDVEFFEDQMLLIGEQEALPPSMPFLLLWSMRCLYIFARKGIRFDKEEASSLLFHVLYVCNDYMQEKDSELERLLLFATRTCLACYSPDALREASVSKYMVFSWMNRLEGFAESMSVGNQDFQSVSEDLYLAFLKKWAYLCKQETISLWMAKSNNRRQAVSVPNVIAVAESTKDTNWGVLLEHAQPLSASENLESYKWVDPVASNSLPSVLILTSVAEMKAPEWKMWKLAIQTHPVLRFTCFLFLRCSEFASAMIEKFAAGSQQSFLVWHAISKSDTPLLRDAFVNLFKTHRKQVLDVIRKLSNWEPLKPYLLLCMERNNAEELESLEQELGGLPGFLDFVKSKETIEDVHVDKKARK